MLSMSRSYITTDRLVMGRRPATTTSCPSHILLIFSSEPPRNSCPCRLVNLERMTIHPKRLASISDNSVLNAFISIGLRRQKKNYKITGGGNIFLTPPPLSKILKPPLPREKCLSLPLS